MAEAVRVLGGEGRAVGADELLANERDELPEHGFRRGYECLDRAAVEQLALDRAAFEHATFRSIELIDARGQQRLDRRWHRHRLRPRVACHRDHLLDEERVACGTRT